MWSNLSYNHYLIIIFSPKTKRGEPTASFPQFIAGIFKLSHIRKNFQFVLFLCVLYLNHRNRGRTTHFVWGSAADLNVGYIQLHHLLSARKVLLSSKRALKKVLMIIIVHHYHLLSALKVLMIIIVLVQLRRSTSLAAIPRTMSPL